MGCEDRSAPALAQVLCPQLSSHTRLGLTQPLEGPEQSRESGGRAQESGKGIFLSLPSFVLVISLKFCASCLNSCLLIFLVWIRWNIPAEGDTGHQMLQCPVPGSHRVGFSVLSWHCLPQGPGLVQDLLPEPGGSWQWSQGWPRPGHISFLYQIRY